MVPAPRRIAGRRLLVARCQAAASRKDTIKKLLLPECVKCPCESLGNLKKAIGEVKAKYYHEDSYGDADGNGRRRKTFYSFYTGEQPNQCA
jgi:hypothetical protein